MFQALYVGDLIFFGSDKSCLTNIQYQHSARFKITNLREISHYLSMEVDVETGKILLRQTSYLKKILERFQRTDCKPMSILSNPSLANSLFPSGIKLFELQSIDISQQLALLVGLL